MKTMLFKLKHYFFTPRWRFSRFEFNLLVAFLLWLGLVGGSFLTVKNIIFPKIFALNDTSKTWTIGVGTSGDYSYDSDFISIGDSGASPGSQANKITNPAFTSNNNSWSTAAVADSGWAEVPGDDDFSTSNFLVMQYEAKYDCTGDDDGDTAAACSAVADSGLGLDYRDLSSPDKDNVVSTANGAPIVHISQTQAISFCPTGYHLISNAEWMTIGRNAEAQSGNWADGVVGSLVAEGGGLYRGNVGNNDSVGYNAGTDPEYGTDRNEKAKLTLSNSSEVWDLSGNVYDWNSDTQTTAVDTVAGWVEWNHANVAEGARALYGPSSATYLSTHGTGKIYGGSLNNAFRRGGYWGEASNAGVFTLALNYSPSNQYYNIGLRCASDSVEISQSFSSSSGRQAAGGNLVSVGSVTDGKLYQSINVGSTASYDFLAYVYNNTSGDIGGTVNSDIAQLYYNGSTISTTYTAVTGEAGWYKLVGTITGAVGTREYGLLVKQDKTILVDDFTLNRQGEYSIYTTSAYSNAQVSSWDSVSVSSIGVTGNANIYYQICLDDGSSCDYSGGGRWQYYTAGAWTNATDGTSTYANTVDELTTAAMQALSIVSQKLSIKVIFVFGGEDMPYLSSIELGLTTDTTAPGNISTILMKKAAGMGTTMAQSAWTNNSSPYFSWNEATDNEGGVGIKGYCLFVSIGDTTANLQTEISSYLPDNSVLDSVHVSSADTECGNGSGFLVSTTDVSFATESYRGDSWLSSSTDDYYLLIKAVDNAGNISDDEAVSFSFRFDNTLPSNPSYVSLPGDYIATKSFTFLWDSSQVADSHSGVAGLQYRIGIGGSWYGDSHSGTEDDTDLLTNDGNYTTIETPDYTALAEGSNLVYLRAWDLAGNVASTYVSSAVKINTISPSVPLNLAVGSSDSDTNSYSFSWDDPSAFTGQASNLTFCYSVNSLPTAISCSYTAGGVNSLSADAYATQPGSNTLYLTAKDEAGNINYENYASVEFTYSGSAPGIPRSIDVSDISIKATSNWKLTVSWEVPSSLGAGVSTYKIYRSIINTTCSSDFSDFSLTGSTAGTSYSDTDLSQQTYYYCVKACDSANSCSAASSTVSKYPNGKYFSAASLTSGPSVSSVTTKRAKISWSTDRNSDSKVAYGKNSGSYYAEEPSKSSQTTSHEISLTNLEPGTTYYYKGKWTDEDGNTGISEEKSFTTSSAPTVKDVMAKNIGLVSAIIQFTSKDASKVKIYYGTTTSFGGVKEISTSTIETVYTTELTSLLDGTKYYYKINTFDSENDEYEGTILDFTTLPRPRISNVRLQQVAGAAQSTILVSWNTNTEVSSIITYYPQDNPGDARDEINIALVAGEHKMIIRGLLADTAYKLVVRGRDKIGNEASSNSQSFNTATDTRPPQISEVQVQGSVIPAVAGTAQESTAQLAVSWNTDEPATSQVEFAEGTGDTYSQKTQEDGNLTYNHLVIISNLTPSKVYHLRTISRDKVGNRGYSIDTVTITPKATANALNLVITNLESVFGFLIGGK